VLHYHLHARVLQVLYRLVGLIIICKT